MFLLWLGTFKKLVMGDQPIVTIKRGQGFSPAHKYCPLLLRENPCPLNRSLCPHTGAHSHVWCLRIQRKRLKSGTKRYLWLGKKHGCSCSLLGGGLHNLYGDLQLWKNNRVECNTTAVSIWEHCKPIKREQHNLAWDKITVHYRFRSQLMWYEQETERASRLLKYGISLL